MSSKYLHAIFLQLAGTIGSGIFALPFLFYSSDIYFSVFILLLTFFITAVLNHFYIEIILHTGGDHQLSGYAHQYLGSKFKYLAFLTIIILAVGAIFTYEKLFISFFQILFPKISAAAIFAIFFILVSTTHLVKFNFLKKFSALIPFIILLIPIILFCYSLNLPPLSFPKATFNFSLFGALLFSLSGFTILPEIEELLRSHPRIHEILPRASFFGLLLTAIIYVIFSYSVIRISSSHPTADSITGIFLTLPFLGRFIALLGLFITFQAALNFILVLRELFYRDLKFSLKKSETFTLSFLVIPLTLFSFSITKVIPLTGSVTIFLSTALICLMRQKLPKNLFIDFLCIFEILCLGLGVILEFI